MMYKKILVAIDGSEIAAHALEHAINLSKCIQSELRAIYVVDCPTVFFSGSFYDPSLLQNAFIEEGSLVTTQAQKIFDQAGIKGDTQIVDTQGGHDIVGAISRAATDWMAECVVLGTHGRRGVQRALLGSTAEAFLRITNVPVLLIREQAPTVAD